MTYTIKKFDTVSSTNDIAKTEAADGAAEGTVIVAASQTAGRGRLSRSFLSPEGGLYMSILLRPSFGVKRSLMLTSMAAVAVVKAIREHAGIDIDENIGVRWVSDIMYKKKKIAAILAEGAVNNDNGFDYIILGVSVNLFSALFPPKLTDIVAEIFSEEHEGLRDKMAKSVLRYFFEMYESFGIDTSFIDEYRSLFILDGKRVRVLADNVKTTATVMGITDDAHLKVRLKDGREYVLNSTGELLTNY